MDVGKYQADRLLAHLFHCLDPIPGLIYLADRNIRLPQYPLQDLSNRRRVIHNQNV